MVELLASIWAFGKACVFPSKHPLVIHMPLGRILFLLQAIHDTALINHSYFGSWFHIFDATIIIVGFVVDVLLHGVLEEIASLVVILRLWRVFKIIEELSAGAQEQMEGLEERVEKLEEEKKSLERRIKELERR